MKSECKSVPERLHLSTVEIPHQFARQRASKCDFKSKTISNQIEGERGEQFYGHVALSPVYRLNTNAFIVCSLVMLLSKRANWLRAKRSKLNEKEMKLHLAVAVITSGRDAVERISTLAIERTRIKRRLTSVDLSDKCFGSFNLTVCPTDINSGICAKGMCVYMSPTIDLSLIVAQGSHCRRIYSEVRLGTVR